MVLLVYVLIGSGLAVQFVSGYHVYVTVVPWKSTYANALATCQKYAESAYNESSRAQTSLPVYKTPFIEAIQNAMKKASVSEVWLPLTRWRHNTWIWIDGDQVGEDITSQGWYDYMRCGALHLRDRILEMDNCTNNNFGFICQLLGGRNCSSGHLSLSECIDTSEGSFYYGCAAENWYDARYRCVEKGMQLAILKNINFRRILSEKLYKGRQCMQAWVGVRKDDWVYRNSTNASGDGLTYWGPGQPEHTRDCATIYKHPSQGYTWRTSDCSSTKHVLCVIKSDGPKGTPDERRSGNIAAFVVIPLLILPILVVLVLCFILRGPGRNKLPDKCRNTLDCVGQEDEVEPSVMSSDTLMPLMATEKVGSVGQLESYGHFCNEGGILHIAGSDIKVHIEKDTFKTNDQYKIRVKIEPVIGDEVRNIPLEEMPLCPAVYLVLPKEIEAKLEQDILLVIPHDRRIRPEEINVYSKGDKNTWRKLLIGTGSLFANTVYCKVDEDKVAVFTTVSTTVTCTTTASLYKHGLSAVIITNNQQEIPEKESRLRITGKIYFMLKVLRTQELLNALVLEHGGEVQHILDLPWPESVHEEEDYIRTDVINPLATGAKRIRDLFNRERLWCHMLSFVVQKPVRTQKMKANGGEIIDIKFTFYGADNESDPYLVNNYSCFLNYPPRQTKGPK